MYSNQVLISLVGRFDPLFRRGARAIYVIALLTMPETSSRYLNFRSYFYATSKQAPISVGCELNCLRLVYTVIILHQLRLKNHFTRANREQFRSIYSGVFRMQGIYMRLWNDMRCP